MKCSSLLATAVGFSIAAILAARHRVCYRMLRLNSRQCRADSCEQLRPVERLLEATQVGTGQERQSREPLWIAGDQDDWQFRMHGTNYSNQFVTIHARHID